MYEPFFNAEKNITNKFPNDIKVGSSSVSQVRDSRRSYVQRYNIILSDIAREDF